jgi:ketosteroid isomerase-like protein
MRIGILRKFILGGLLVVANALTAQQPGKGPTGGTSWSRAQPVKFGSDLQREFRALETQWMDAAKAQNRPRLEEFLAPDYVLTIAVLGKPLVHVSRADWLDAPYKIQAYEFKELVARSFGNGVVVVTSYYTQKASMNGKDRSGDFFLTDVWVRDGNRWRVTWRHSSQPETR